MIYYYIRVSLVLSYVVTTLQVLISIVINRNETFNRKLELIELANIEYRSFTLLNAKSSMLISLKSRNIYHGNFPIACVTIQRAYLMHFDPNNIH